MIPADEFMRHAAECERMAKTSRDPQSKAVWRRMAERWTQCAKLARERYTPQPGQKAKQHRKPMHAWAH